MNRILLSLILLAMFGCTSPTTAVDTGEQPNAHASEATNTPNPCDENNGGCGENAQCTSQGSEEPLCTCKPGFLYNAEGVCVPTPACQFVICEQHSHCEEGACVCDEGYEAGTEGSCVDIDECLRDNGGCGDAAFWECTNLDGGSSCAEKTEEFFSRCVYVPGQYDQAKDFRSLDALMTENERGAEKVKRVFYLSIPPSIFVPVAQNAARECQTGDTRVIVEKPFGRDLQSSRELTAALASELSEEQTYRIDHYLGKELIENLTVLRFSNIMFQPLWNRNYIRNVQINFSENFGTEGRGGYFDNYGIIRDIMQNHLLQILALFAMEEPASLDAEDIRNEKVKVIRSMRPIEVENVALGQYKGREAATKKYPAYLDDETVPKGSLCPTFAAMALFISVAPRPYRTPSIIFPPNGSTDHESGLPSGTTSVWPAKQKLGLSVPSRAYRLSTSGVSSSENGKR